MTAPVNNRFADWPTSSLAAECRSQARDQLDPEFSQFMDAVSERLDSLAPAPVESGVVERVRQYLAEQSDADECDPVDRDATGLILTFGDLRALLALAASKEERVSEPTEAMIKAGGFAAYMEDVTGGDDEAIAQRIWRAMCAAQVGG